MFAKIIITVSAFIILTIVSGALVSGALEAGAYLFDHRIAAVASHQITNYHVTDGGSNINGLAAASVDPDPTDGRSIIIECVVLGDRATANASESKNIWKIRPVRLPRHKLGPSKCWPNEDDETAIAAAAERALKPAR